MNDNKSLIIKIVLVLIVIISLYFIITGLSSEDEKEVKNNDILETGLIVNPTSIKLEVGEEKEVTATVVPENATYKNLNWEVANPNLISLEGGTIKGLSAGTTYIKITTEKQKISRIVNITVVEKAPVTVSITEIKPKESSIELYVGDTKKIEYTIVPTDATDKKISFSTSDKSTVGFNKDGMIVGVKEGLAVITLKSNNVEAKINVSVKKKEVTPVSKTKDKTAIFIGDSITMGKYDNYSWANYIGENYDLKKSVNAGISGGVFSSYRGQYWLVDVVKQHKGESYDYVILHGGINDISMLDYGETKGSYTADDFSGNYDTSTFIGGLETYIYTAKQQWPNAKIGYIINYRTPQSDVDKNSSKYYGIIRDVCKKWGIKYINLYSGKSSTGEKYSDILKVKTNTYIEDGAHLNKEGYKVISPYIYKWMKNL